MSSSLDLYGTPTAVIAEEIKSLKPTRKVWEKRAGLFFLSDRDTALKNAEERIEAEKEVAAEKASAAKSRAGRACWGDQDEQT